MGAILTFDHVTKDFGGVRAIDDFSLDIESGQITGIIGPNGAGKSTLFNVTCGVLHPTKGRIFFKGQPIEKLLPHQVCQKGIGRTFQLSEVFKSLSALESIAVAASLHLPINKARERAEELLENFGLANKADWVAASLTPVDVKLVELCKALATQPQLILLDEVMSGLNMVEAQMILDKVKKLPQQGITPIIVEHGMHIIKAVCEKVAVLNFGRLLTSGHCEDVLQNKEVIDSYLGEETVSA